MSLLAVARDICRCPAAWADLLCSLTLLYPWQTAQKGGRKPYKADKRERDGYVATDAHVDGRVGAAKEMRVQGSPSRDCCFGRGSAARLAFRPELASRFWSPFFITV